MVPSMNSPQPQGPSVRISDAGSKPAGEVIRLGTAALGFVGIITAVDARHLASTEARLDIAPEELEQRLLEMGFVEGARVEIRHQGPIARDPIAVRVNNAVIALRRAEANAIYVSPILETPVAV